jgi:hypothetical protein
VSALTVDPLARVVVELESDNDHRHIVCCRTDRSLCGEDQTGVPCAEERECPDEELCIRCLVIEEAEVPCGAPFCRARSWWRNRTWLP